MLALDKFLKFENCQFFQGGVYSRLLLYYGLHFAVGFQLFGSSKCNLYSPVKFAAIDVNEEGTHASS